MVMDKLYKSEVGLVSYDTFYYYVCVDFISSCVSMYVSHALKYSRFYSGVVAGAREALLCGVPSLSISLDW
jgi:broad specificity polyphosphatase/5'/3'-nucleotidase SurE